MTIDEFQSRQDCVVGDLHAVGLAWSSMARDWPNAAMLLFYTKEK